jgi:hypothetical protein
MFHICLCLFVTCKDAKIFGYTKIFLATGRMNASNLASFCVLCAVIPNEKSPLTPKGGKGFTDLRIYRFTDWAGAAANVEM